MNNAISAKLDAGGLRFAVVVSRFNEFITSRLLAGARDALVRHGAAEKDIREVWVPGCWEMPLTASVLAKSGRHDAVICLGCVIRGDTTHHVYVANEATKGLAQVSLETGTPVGFGILTTDTIEQAIERAGTKSGNKGADAALSAVEMVNLLRQVGPKRRASK
jgi:6,7-dimethyl-8-ribityllumazine synthase